MIQRLIIFPINISGDDAPRLHTHLFLMLVLLQNEGWLTYIIESCRDGARSHVVGILGAPTHKNCIWKVKLEKFDGFRGRKSHVRQYG